MSKQIFIYYLGSDFIARLDYETPTNLSDNQEDKHINALESRNKAIIEHPDSEKYSILDFIQAFNEEVISDLGWIAFKEEEYDSSEITINIVELSSELAHDAARDEMIKDTTINNEEEMWDNTDEQMTVYTEQAQEVFNRWYDFYYEFIERFKQ